MARNNPPVAARPRKVDLIVETMAGRDLLPLIERARRDLAAVRGQLLTMARHSSEGAPDRRRLEWLAHSIARYLEKGGPSSLDQALGLTPPRGRPRTSIWAERAARLDAGEISREAAMIEWQIQDTRTLEKGLARGRQINARAAILQLRAQIEPLAERMGAEIAADLKAPKTKPRGLRAREKLGRTQR